jgi:stage II sporulation protein D
VVCSPYPVYKATPTKKRTTHVKQPRGANEKLKPQKASAPQTPAQVNSGGWEVSTDSSLSDSSFPTGSTDAGSWEIGPDSTSVSTEKQPSAPGSLLRVVIGQNMKRANLSSTGKSEIRWGNPQRVVTQGLLSFSVSASPGRLDVDVSDTRKGEVTLPCTLGSTNELNLIRFNGKSYRGSVIMVSERRGVFSVVNYCDVEDYLRGVVPLEIGNCTQEEIEAVKAQAVAARTYTYKKIQENKNQYYDLFPDISDQVYGGVNAEKNICNQAIRDTRGLVVVYPASGQSDSLIFAYYHSTCGGRTANVEDVWDKSPFPYLRSVKDCDESGRPFCAGSGSFSWEESWPIQQLSGIAARFSREAFPDKPITGPVTDIVIDDRFACGRTKTCRVKTTNGTVTYGGDKLRFVLRRNTAGYPVLRSSIISEAHKNGGTFVVKGRGYGHGIGMCQFGAIGRARAGQTCEQIIKAYYTGVEIRSIGK